MLSLMKTWFGGNRSSRSSRPSRPSVRLSLESLEDRFVPSTLTVTSIADSGSGSLRNAVNAANTDSQRGQADTIVFAKSLQGHSIYLNTPVVLNGGRGTITINGLGSPTITGRYDAFGITLGTTVSMNNVAIKKP